jgi:hypothetical protein
LVGLRGVESVAYRPPDRPIVDTGRSQLCDLLGERSERLLRIRGALLAGREDLLGLDGVAEAVADAVAPYGAAAMSSAVAMSSSSSSTRQASYLVFASRPYASAALPEPL